MLSKKTKRILIFGILGTLTLFVFIMGTIFLAAFASSIGIISLPAFIIGLGLTSLTALSPTFLAILAGFNLAASIAALAVIVAEGLSLAITDKFISLPNFSINIGLPSFLNSSVEVSNRRPEITLNFILLGDENTGKSALIDRYIFNKFEEHTATDTDKGFKYGVKHCEYDQQMYNIKLFSSAGQTATAASIATGIILIFDLTNINTRHNIVNRFQEIKEKAPKNARLILVGNKADQMKTMKEKDSSLQAQAWAEAQDISYIETSAKDGTNVTKVFETLVRECSEVAQGNHPLRTELLVPFSPPEDTPTHQNSAI